MKKKLLALVCFVLLISILLCSCNIVIDRRPDGEDTKQSSNTDPKKPESTKNTTNNTQQGTSQGNENNSGKIEKLNGKSARDIVKSFFDTYSTITSVDMISYNFIVSEGVRYEETQELKLYGSNIYMRMSSGDEEMKIWNVGGMMYIDAYGEKAKVQMDIEDYFGASISDILTSTIPTDLPSLYLAEFNSSQIYKSGSTYYFTAKFSAQEAYEIYRDYGAEFGDISGFSETFYCDENGTIKSIVTSNDDGSSNKIVFNSYGQYVSIPTPENSHLFVEMDINDLYPDYGGNGDEYYPSDNDFGNGEVDEEAYYIYSMILDYISTAESYELSIDKDEAWYLDYGFCGYDEYVYLSEKAYLLENGGYAGYYEKWYVDGVAYGRKESGTIARVANPSDEFFYTFGDVRMKVQTVLNKYSKSDMTYMSMEHMNYVYYIEFALDNGEDMVDYYYFQIDELYDFVRVDVIQTLDGYIMDYMSYEFYGINSTKVYAPQGVYM